jgi:Cdc6-like AAA superfamily ATPase
MPDPFELRAERAIIQSGVREVFTPHRPVKVIDHLFGRGHEVAALIQQINTPGQHALLYGERGVGKSSLANVAAELLLQMLTEHLYPSRCDSASTFESILRAPLADAGVDIELVEQTLTHSDESTRGASVRIIEARGATADSSVRIYRPTIPISPSRAAELLASLQGLLVVDELDSVALDEKRKLAEFIKLLSDADSEFKVLAVGIADTADELTGGHPSVARCLKETRVPRMSESGLREIVTGGQQAVGLVFTDPAITAIVRVSSGYPHFTHLLCLKAAEAAIVEQRGDIDRADVQNAMDAARVDAEGTLKRVYEDAVRSYGTDMYRHILQAAANLTRVDRIEFTASDFRASVEHVTGAPITQGSLNNHLKRLVSADGRCVLTRMAKGVYRFTDPRMPSYVRIANGTLD